MEILIGTRNEGKIREIIEALALPGLELLDLRNFPEIGDIEETGLTFAENAALKACHYAMNSNVKALADDSGLEVDALNGRPGIYSARYAGVGASSQDRIKKLLAELEGSEDRAAQFRASMALADPKGRIIFEADGICRGRIAMMPSGEGGFGYDPVFIPDGFEATFAELSTEIKQKISHRAIALEKIINFLGFRA